MHRFPTRLRTMFLIGAAVVAMSAGAGAARGATHTIEISDFAFAPATLTITAGDTVTWTNADPVEHTATSTSGAFDSGLLAEGESFSMTFTTPGTYDYLCTPHPMMTGRIVVVAAAPAPSAAPSAGAGGTPPSGGGLPNVAMDEPASPGSPATALGVLLLAVAAGLATVRLAAPRPSARARAR